MPIASSSMDDLWSGRPFAEMSQAPPPSLPPVAPPTTSARSVVTAEETEADAAEDGDDAMDAQVAASNEDMARTLVQEIQLLREDRLRSFRGALALSCLAFAVIAGYLDRLLRELRRRPLVAAPGGD